MTPISIEANKLFPTLSGTNLSHEFVVNKKAVVVRAFGLRTGQRVVIEQGARLPCDVYIWGPLRICCPVELNPNLTQVVIGVSGLYRAYIDDPQELGIEDITVVQHVVDLNEKTTTCCKED